MDYKLDDEVITFEAPLKIRKGKIIGYEPDMTALEENKIFNLAVGGAQYEYDIENNVAYVFCRVPKRNKIKFENKIKENTNKFKFKFSKKVKQKIKDKVKKKKDFMAELHNQTEVLNGLGK